MKKLKMCVAVLASLLVMAACSSDSSEAIEDVSGQESVVEVNVTTEAEQEETQEDEEEPEQTQDEPEEHIQEEPDEQAPEDVELEQAEEEAENATPSQEENFASDETIEESTAATDTVQIAYSTATISLADIPAYSGSPYVAVNNNEPYFTEADLTTTSYEYYSDLDSLGRCGVAVANIGQDIIPTEERGAIGSIKPTGWHTVKYDIVDGNYLYNRCHLIGYQLSGESANEKNLITGTRYLNVEGMLPFENMVADYVEETNNHVLYRVTPIFDGNNLVASGALMEAMSVEDNGEGILFNVYCYNVRPGVGIDYATGDSWLEETASTTAVAEASSQNSSSTSTASAGSSESAVTEGTCTETAAAAETTPAVTEAETSTTSGTTYILNTNTKKFYYPSCSSVDQMSEKNKWEYTWSRDDIIAMGYDPCKRCNP